MKSLTEQSIGEFISASTPVNISVELEFDYTGGTITLQWGKWDVFDEDDFDGYEEEDKEEETQGKIEREELYSLLIRVRKCVEETWKGIVEEGSSDLDEGTYRIRLLMY